jgi:hypothetical protein
MAKKENGYVALWLFSRMEPDALSLRSSGGVVKEILSLPAKKINL